MKHAGQPAVASQLSDKHTLAPRWMRYVEEQSISRAGARIASQTHAPSASSSRLMHQEGCALIAHFGQCPMEH